MENPAVHFIGFYYAWKGGGVLTIKPRLRGMIARLAAFGSDGRVDKPTDASL